MIGSIVQHKFGTEMVIIGIILPTKARSTTEYTCRYLNRVSGDYRTGTFTEGELIFVLSEPS